MLVVRTVLYLTLGLVYRLEDIHVHDVLFTILTSQITDSEVFQDDFVGYLPVDFLAVPSLVRYPGGVQKSKPTKSQR